MSFIFIIVLMVILIAFIAVAIGVLSKQVGKQIDKNVAKVVDTYDVLLEEKSQQLQDLKQEIEQLKQQASDLKMKDESNSIDYSGFESSLIVESSNYVDDSFFTKYNLIQQQFSGLAKEAASKTALLLSQKRRNINVHEYKELLNIFDYELQYQMDTLRGDDQRKVIDTIINHSDGKKRIVERYQKEFGEFNFEGFIDYLRSYIYFNDNVVKVYSFNGERIVPENRPNILYLQDTSIGDGYVVRYRNEFYDFSLKGGHYE